MSLNDSRADLTPTSVLFYTLYIIEQCYEIDLKIHPIAADRLTMVLNYSANGMILKYSSEFIQSINKSVNNHYTPIAESIIAKYHKLTNCKNE